MLAKTALILATLAGCALSQKRPGGIITSSMDPSSFGNVDVIYTTNMTLNVTVNFDTRKLFGYIDLEMKAIQDTSEVILDYQGIDLVSAHYKPIDGQEFIDAFYDTFTSPTLGSAMRIYLTDKVTRGNKIIVRVYYSTNENAIAINWLTPQQTSSKTLSYMFTEC
jgi:leukotriene-A4 hydrolase